MIFAANSSKYLSPVGKMTGGPEGRRGNFHPRLTFP